MLAHQHLAHVVGTRHPDQGPAQEVGLEHVAVLLSPRRVEARTLEGRTEKGGGGGRGCGVRIMKSDMANIDRITFIS